MTLIFKIITILAEVNPKYKDEIRPSILGLLKSYHPTLNIFGFFLGGIFE